MRERLIWLISGIFLAVILFSVCRREKKPQVVEVVRERTDTLRIVRMLPAETVRAQKIIRISDTLVDTVVLTRVIDWKLYEFRDAFIRAQIEADTVRRFSYMLLQKQKTREVGILVNTQSVVLYTKPASWLIVGAGWNLERKTPELAVGVYFQW